MCIALLLMQSVSVYGSNELGILYLVEKNGRRNLVLGTMHRTAPFLHGYLNEMDIHFRQAQGLLVELDSANQSANVAALQRAARTNTPLIERLGPELYGKLKRQMGYGSDSMFPYQGVKPWFIWSILVSPEDSGDYMDLKLQRIFRQQGKPVTALETVDDQIEVFESLSEADQLQLLSDAINHREQIRALAAEMLYAYRSRNLHELKRLSLQLPWDADKALYERLYEAHLDGRNKQMLRTIKNHFNAGFQMAAVGAMHLPGENGLLRMLERDGYTITTVY